jgi:thymidine phosphorylase
MTDTVDPAVGFVFLESAGDRVTRGQPVAEIHARTATAAAEARTTLGKAITIAEHADLLPLVSHRVTVDGVEALA